MTTYQLPQPICAMCWRLAHPTVWPIPWKLTDKTEICHVCGHPTESGIREYANG